MGDEETRINLPARNWSAALFDLDGVLTDTSRVHAAAWRALFDEVLRHCAARTGEAVRPFDPRADYLAHVDGRRREDGVRTFLASRGIALPEGSAADPEDAMTVAALARRKQALFEAALRQGGAEPAPGAAALLAALRRLRVPVAVVSASRNCAAVLAAAGLDRLVDLRVDGEDAAALGLAGKPAPDTFLEAARRLGVPPARCAVFEDALAGVEAARRGGFGLVVGVDRGGQAEALRRHGADLVVRDLAEVAVTAA
ncbi:MAG: beta-phosphoglucomutase family hydrolase [Acetobacteraceae bacterium]|nr:beta-phosphoglucomutase family hydrolase [Acetobacteraceae bacterium]